MAHHLDLHRLAAALDGEVSRDQILCPGPGHSPVDRSLSVKLDAGAPDGFLIHSFADDDPIVCRDHVRSKCGLPAFKPNGHRGSLSSEDIQRRVRTTVMAQTQTPKGLHSATYRYVDAEGVLLYEVLRYDNPKTFRQRRPNGKGWIWDAGERRVLYRLPELRQFPDATVFFTEGEKDADRLAELGHCATTIASGKWTPDCVQSLAGRDVWILEDNDEAGRKRAREVAEALHGMAKTIRIVQLPGLPDKGDVSDWLDADRRNADKLVDVCGAAPLWQPTSPLQASTLKFIDLDRWEAPVPERLWSTYNRFPLRQVALLSGEGAVGKSIVLLQLCAAHVLAHDWLGALPEPGPAIYIGAEDDEDELWRRMADTVVHYSASMSDLKRGGFYALSLAGEDAILGRVDRNGIVQPTQLFAQLKEAACDIKPKLIGLDTASDIFAGVENDRAQVRQFIGLLRGVAMASNSTVLICSHPSLTGINSGTGLSGSTAWHNSVRARAYMHPLTTNGGEEPDPELRQLEFKKNQYGPIAESVLLRWKNGVFCPEPRMGSLEQLARERKAEELFLTLLVNFERQGRPVSHKQSPSFAPALFAKQPEAKTAGVTKAALDAAMNRLFTNGKIHVEHYGKPSRPFSKIVVKQ